MEEQEWPVTPYQIKVYTLPHCPLSFFSVYVDGVKVGEKSAEAWQRLVGTTKDSILLLCTTISVLAVKAFSLDK